MLPARGGMTYSGGVRDVAAFKGGYCPFWQLRLRLRPYGFEAPKRSRLEGRGGGG
jgi:hypothetical protein